MSSWHQSLKGVSSQFSTKKMKRLVSRLETSKKSYLTLRSTWPTALLAPRMDNVNHPFASTSTHQRIVCELSIDPGTPLPHLAFKTALLKTFGEFVALESISHTVLLIRPYNKTSSAPNPDVSVSLTSLCVGHMNLCLVTNGGKVNYMRESSK